jgi:peptide/nickel transport system substrate-binding protein
MNDANAAMAALLAGDVQVATDIALKFEQGLILQRGWVAEKKGTVISRNGSYHAAWFQLRPEFASPRAQLDLRVRKALAHSVNKQDVLDAVFEGHGTISEVPCIPPSSSYYPEAERAVVKYPYDPRMTEQLMADSGFRKSQDGVFVGSGESPLRFELKTLVSAERQKAQAVLTANWRRSGFEFGETLLPPAQAVDSEQRATFPGIFNFTQSPGEYALAHDYSSAGIGRPENRWFGNNRGAWSNEEFDRFSAAFANAVTPADRIQYIAQLARVMTENVPGIPLYFELGTEAFAASVQGPKPVAQESVIPWNIHEWTLQ